MVTHGTCSDTSTPDHRPTKERPWRWSRYDRTSERPGRGWTGRPGRSRLRHKRPRGPSSRGRSSRVALERALTGRQALRAARCRSRLGQGSNVEALLHGRTPRRGRTTRPCHDLSSLSGEVEAVARGDRSMQQCRSSHTVLGASFAQCNSVTEPAHQEGQARRARLPQLHQLLPAAAIALRRQVADSPNSETASALPTLGGVEPVSVCGYGVRAGQKLTPENCSCGPRIKFKLPSAL